MDDLKQALLLILDLVTVDEQLVPLGAPAAGTIVLVSIPAENRIKLLSNNILGVVEIRF